MGKIKEILIDTFSGGQATDPRDKNFKKFYHSKHFDAFSFSHKLKPRFDSADKGSAQLPGLTALRFWSSADKNNTNTLWCLVENGSGNGVIIKWNTTTEEWDSPDGNLFDTTTVSENAFIAYNDGTDTKLYLLDGARYLMCYDLDEASGSTEQEDDLGAYTYDAPFLLNTIDDILYIFKDNEVWYKDGDSAAAQASITFPEDTYIAMACQYGNYIAIAVNWINEIKSAIFLWDRDTSLETATERYDFESSKIYQIANLQGRLMVMDTDFIDVYFRRFNGSEFSLVNKMIGVRQTNLQTNNFYRFNTIRNDILLFPMSLDVPGYGDSYNTRLGIWALDSNGKVTLDTVIEGATTYKGLYYWLGDLWVCYNTDKTAKTGITYSKTNPSVYETLFIGDASRNKTLLAVGARTEPLPADGQIVIKYRTAEDSDWTTISTETTDDSRYHDAVNIESTGAIFEDFREIQFRVESTGGAVLTGLRVRYEEKDDNIGT